MRWITWNVNGIRAAEKKGFMDFFRKWEPDVLCVQETKALPEQFPSELTEIPGYHFFSHSAQRKGYSGVATWCRTPPEDVQTGIGVPEFDAEGRVLRTRHAGIFLYNVYFPNGSGGPERLEYKKRFYHHLRDIIAGHLDHGESVVVCGDYNTARHPIDLARPKENEKNSGFLPEEREWLETYFSLGLVDAFRHLHPDEPGQYSWWDYRFSARERNIGWRIDYFLVSPDLADRITDCRMLADVMGSDHCPVLLELAANPKG